MKISAFSVIVAWVKVRFFARHHECSPDWARNSREDASPSASLRLAPPTTLQPSPSRAAKLGGRLWRAVEAKTSRLPLDEGRQ